MSFAILALFATVLITAVIILRLYGPASPMMLGVVGLFAYSLPALVGFFVAPGNANSAVNMHTSGAATTAVLVFWISFLFTAIVFRYRRASRLKFNQVGPVGTINANRALNILLILSISLYIYIGIRQGWLFFMSQRAAISSSNIQVDVIWRWVNAATLLFALMAKRWDGVAVSLIFIAMYFIAGDRTVITILMGALVLYYLGGRRLSEMVLNPGQWLIFASGLVFVILGKPIYLSAKSMSFAPIMDSLFNRSAVSQISYFEPFVVFNQLEVVIARHFSYPFSEFAVGTLGQFLIVPSLFGIDSGGFNVAFTTEFYRSISYGLAYNYLAEGYSIGGLAGIMLFGAAYAVFILVLSRLAVKAGVVDRAFLLLAISIIAIYIHRNSMENILSFERQIFLIWVFVKVCLLALSVGDARSGRSPMPVRRMAAMPSRRSMPQNRRSTRP